MSKSRPSSFNIQSQYISPFVRTVRRARSAYLPDISSLFPPRCMCTSLIQLLWIPFHACTAHCLAGSLVSKALTAPSPKPATTKSPATCSLVRLVMHELDRVGISMVHVSEEASHIRRERELPAASTRPRVCCHSSTRPDSAYVLPTS